jgi:lipoyl(octanoyl) transferase
MKCAVKFAVGAILIVVCRVAAWCTFVQLKNAIDWNKRNDCSSSRSMQTVKYQSISHQTYQQVWDYQHEVHRALIAHKLEHKRLGLAIDQIEQAHRLILCEHAPVFTLGRSGDVQNLLLSEAQLAEQGIEYFPINRGGDITYHGPGQITGYPLLDLDCFYNDVHKYVRMLEEVVIRVIAEYGLKGGRIEGYTGVWLSDGAGHRKVCAIGVHLSRWVTLHGFALNVNTDLQYFEKIVPCGIVDPDKSVTSMAQELGQIVPMQEIKDLYVQHFADVFGCRVSSL